MPAPPNTSFQSCSRFCSRPRLPFISSRTQLIAPGHRPTPRGSDRGVPQLSGSPPPPPALSAPISGRPGVPSLAPALSGSSAAPALRRSRPSPGSRTCASAAVRHLPASKGHSLGDLLLNPRPSPVPGAVPSASAAPARFPARLPPLPWAPARHAPSRSPPRATEAPKPGAQPGPLPSQTLAGRERPP